MSAQRKLPLFPLAVLPLTLAAAFAHADGDTVVEGASLDTVYVTAEKQLQQSLGVSRISNEDIEKRPAVNDISELVRTMPGVKPHRQHRHRPARQQTPNRPARHGARKHPDFD